MKGLLFLRRYVVPWYRAFLLDSLDGFLGVPGTAGTGLTPKGTENAGIPRKGKGIRSLVVAV